MSTLTLTSGSFIAPSSTLALGLYSTGDKFYFGTAIANMLSGDPSLFTHNNGTVYIRRGTYDGSEKTVNTISGAFNLWNLSFDAPPSGFGVVAELVLSGGPTISRTFTLVDGSVTSGTVSVGGNVTIGASADGGASPILFTGGNDQVYTDQGGNEPDGDITINKTAGAVTLASNADWNATNQDLTITAGLLIVPGNYNLATGALTVGASGNLRMSGTGDLTLGGTLTNSGDVSIRSTTCGQDDYVLIRSSSTGVQRSWDGSGTFTLYDVDVRDMAGTAAITCYSSTNTANNGGNWTFSGAACPDLPVALGLPSGTINLGSGVVNLK